MSFQDLVIAINVENNSQVQFNQVAVQAANMSTEVVGATESVSVGFQQAGAEAEAMADKVKLSGDSVKEMSRDFTTLGVGISSIGRLGETFGLLNQEQAECVLTMGLSLSAIAGVVRAVQIFNSATSVATAVQNALNISYGTFLALTGVGIAVIVAAAAAMTYFASQMNSATASVKNYNTATSDMTSSSRNIRRAGEDDLRRRGIE
ncbi:MAG: hypothetical protein NUK63_03380 [Candidatus Bathyarchaeum tardum]|nr:MAG: hypothetical protein NUK63_03380 [Candidatus Bathyarchaeum tardum]